jgi:hypothetical protein
MSRLLDNALEDTGIILLFPSVYCRMMRQAHKYLVPNLITHSFTSFRIWNVSCQTWIR